MEVSLEKTRPSAINLKKNIVSLRIPKEFENVSRISELHYNLNNITLEPRTVGD